MLLDIYFLDGTKRLEKRGEVTYLLVDFEDEEGENEYDVDVGNGFEVDLMA